MVWVERSIKNNFSRNFGSSVICQRISSNILKIFDKINLTLIRKKNIKEPKISFLKLFYSIHENIRTWECPNPTNPWRSIFIWIIDLKKVVFKFELKTRIWNEFEIKKLVIWQIPSYLITKNEPEECILVTLPLKRVDLQGDNWP